ncbi:MAG TPA: hypothetical protein VG148_15740 [Pyrinomonadaceae bacterium]|nr:hypothetical protein [Pyrinomonadaceae bacterium]
MNYPLQLTFKRLAIARQLSVKDAGGQLIFYVKRKAFKLKEAVTVFADAAQTVPVYTILADRVLDFSAHYHFTDPQGREVGSVKRQGMKSIWKARYEVRAADGQTMLIQEANPWTKVLDSVVGELPVVGMFTGYLLHPAYLVSSPQGSVLLRLEKQPAFFEGRFKIEKQGTLNEAGELAALLALLMVVMLEKGRG